MKPKTRFASWNRISFCLGAGVAVAALVSQSGHAAARYWDANGNTSGSGGAMPSGTWTAAGLNWSTNPEGTTASVAGTWSSFTDVANFSAGSDATGAYTMTVSGAILANGIVAEDGTLTLAGTATPALSMGGVGVTINSTVSGATTFDSTLGNIALGASQSWANNSSQAFNVNCGVTGGTGTAFTLTLAGSGAGGTTFNGNITNSTQPVALTINTTGGTTTLSGLNTYTGLTTVNRGGTLTLNFAGAAAPTTAVDIIKNANNMTLAGGVLNITGNTSGANSQTFGATTFSAGANANIINVTTGGATINVALGGLSRSGQSTLDLTLPGSGSVTTTLVQAPSNGVLTNSSAAAYATANSGASWVSKATGSSPFALTALSTYGSTYTSTTNVDVIHGDTPASGFTVNTLRFNAANDGLTLAGTNVVTTGGILVTANGTGSSITGGTITSGTAASEVFIHDYGSISIGSVIANSNAGANATSLTLTGSGTTTLSGANTYSGSTSINQGTVKVRIAQNGTTSGAFGGQNNGLSLGSGATLDLNGFNVGAGVATFNAGSIVTSASGGTLTVGNNNGSLSGINNAFAITGSASLTVNGTGSFSNNPTFTSTSTGTLTLQNTSQQRYNNLAANLGSSMTLAFNGNGQLQNTSSQALGSGNGLVINGTGNTWNYQSTTSVAGAVTGNGTLALTNGNNPTFTFSGNLTGFHGSLIFNGSGNNQALQFSNTTTFGDDAKWTLNQSSGTSISTDLSYFNYIGTGNKTIILGELSGTNAGAGSTSLRNQTAATTATWQIGGANTNSSYLGIIQNGAGTSALTKLGSGTLNLNAANTYTGLTTVSGGVLALGASGSIANSSGVALNAGNFNVSAVAGGYTLGPAQSLTGSGAVTGNLNISGNLAVGNSPGMIDFGGDLGLNSTAISDFEFTLASFADNSYDLATGSGNVHFGGTLNLLFDSGVTYTTSSTVRIFDFTGGCSGSFSSVNFSGLGAGQSATFNVTTGVVTVIPESGAALLGGIGVLFLLRRRRA